MNNAIHNSMNSREWLMLLALSFLWGGSFFFVGVAVRELPTFTVVVARVALAALILLAVLRLRGIAMPTGAGVWRAFFAMGLLNNVIPFSLLVWGQAHIASGVAAILNAATPVATVVVAHFLTADERMSGLRVAGVLVGLAGVGVMVGFEAMETTGLAVWGQAACVSAAIAYAFAGVYGRRFKAMGISPIATATGQVCASSLVLLPLMAVVDQPWTLPLPGMATLASLVGVAAFSTALAYILYFRILATAGATNLLLVTLLIPATSIALGVTLLDEAMRMSHFVGLAVIGCGLLAIDGRLFCRG